mgnify:FL=1
MLFDHENIKGFSFSDVILVHNRTEMALVPSAFHQPETAATILQTIHGPARTVSPLFCKIRALLIQLQQPLVTTAY